MATRLVNRPNILTSGATFALSQAMAWSPRSTAHSIPPLLWPADLSIRDRLMRLVWLPFWISSDLPAPPMSRITFEQRSQTETGRRLLAILRSIRRRQLIFRFFTLIARSMMLTVIVGSIWALIALADGPMLNADVVTAIGLCLAAIGGVYGWHYRPGVREVARMLDVSFDLSDRMTTAVDHLSAKAPSPAQKLHVIDLQIVDAINSVAMIHHHPALRIRAPVREIVACVGFSLVFLAIFLMRGTGGGLPVVGSSSVPAFVSAKDRLQQKLNPQTVPAPNPEVASSVAEIQARAELSASAEADLLQIAEALSDNPLTSSISDAIRAGDYERAAAELAAVSSELSQLSPELRDELATALDEAADAMTGQHPGLQDATEDAADGLRSDPATAEKEMTDLSSAIEETGAKVESQEDLSAEMRDAREAEESGSQSSDSRPEPGDQSGVSQEEEQEIAGTGGDAASGQSNQSGDSRSQNTQGSGSDEQQQGGDSSSDSASQDDSGAGEQSSSSSGDDGGESQSAEGQQSEGQGGTRGAPNGVEGKGNPDTESPGGNSDQAQEGAGAGGQSDEDVPGNRQTSNGTQQRPGNRSSDSPTPNVEEGEGANGVTTGSDTGATGDSITLSRAPDDSGYQSGGASSSSSGSGSGAAAGAGTVEQGDVGSAGPDSNRVPEEYRPVVEDYFSDEP